MSEERSAATYTPRGIEPAWWAEFRAELRALGIARLSANRWSAAIKLRQSAHPPSPKAAASLIAASPK